MNCKVPFPSRLRTDGDSEVAYDEGLAERVRQALEARERLREVKMFGGLAFMLEERMVVCVSTGGGALLVRVDPAEHAQLLDKPGAQQAEMGHGRSMGKGWISVADSALTSEDALQWWLLQALDFHAKDVSSQEKR